MPADGTARGRPQPALNFRRRQPVLGEISLYLAELGCGSSRRGGFNVRLGSSGSGAARGPTPNLRQGYVALNEGPRFAETWLTLETTPFARIGGADAETRVAIFQAMASLADHMRNRPDGG